jgi:hypothetical protein
VRLHMTFNAAGTHPRSQGVSLLLGYGLGTQVDSGPGDTVPDILHPTFAEGNLYEQD